MQPGALEKIYFHEGCHLYYFREIHASAKFVPPCIWYDKKTGQYAPIIGAVDTEGIQKRCDNERLLGFAKAAVSGGVMLAVCNLKSGVPKALILRGLGDRADQDDFKILCEEIRKLSPELPDFDSDAAWYDAKTTIAPDFFNPSIRAQIDATVAEVKTDLFAAIYPDGL
jgi:hypothetical protein